MAEADGGEAFGTSHKNPLLDRLNIESKWLRHCVSMAWLFFPNTLTLILGMMIGFASSIMVGRQYGKDALSAATLGNMISNAFGYAIGGGFGMALDPLCSQAFGARKYRLVGLYCQRAMVILTLICIPIIAVWLQTERILLLFGMPENIASLSQSWVNMLIPGLWPRMMYEAMRRYTLSQRIVWPVTASVAVSSFIHIGLSYVLLYVYDTGFRGAAISTTISNYCMLGTLVLMTYVRVRFQRKHNYATKNGYELHALQTSPSRTGLLETQADTPDGLDDDVKVTREPLDGGLEADSEADSWPSPFTMDLFRGWWEFIRLGAPSAASLFIEWGSYEVNAAIAGAQSTVDSNGVSDTTPLSTHAVLMQTAALWYMVPMGIALSASTLIGNALGAGNAAEASELVQLAYVLETLWGVCNGMLFTLAIRRLWGRLFTPDVEVIDYVTSMLPVMWAYGLFDAIKCVGMAVLRSCARPSITVAGNLVACLLVGYPTSLTLVFVFKFKLYGLWSGMTFAWLIVGAFYFWIIMRTDWNEQVELAAERNQKGLESMQNPVAAKRDLESSSSELLTSEPSDDTKTDLSASTSDSSNSSGSGNNVAESFGATFDPSAHSESTVAEPTKILSSTVA